MARITGLRTRHSSGTVTSGETTSVSLSLLSTEIEEDTVVKKMAPQVAIISDQGGGAGVAASTAMTIKNLGKETNILTIDLRATGSAGEKVLEDNRTAEPGELIRVDYDFRNLSGLPSLVGYAEIGGTGPPHSFSTTLIGPPASWPEPTRMAAHSRPGALPGARCSNTASNRSLDCPSLFTTTPG